MPDLDILSPVCVPKAAQIQPNHTADTTHASRLKPDENNRQFQRQQQPPQPAMRVYNRQPIARCRDTQQQTTPVPMKQVPLPQPQQVRALDDQRRARYTHAQQQTTPVPIIQRQAPLMQDRSVGDQRIATYTDTQQQTTPAPIKQEHGSLSPATSARYDAYQAQLQNQLYIMEDRCRALIDERDLMAQDVDRLASTNKGQVDAIHNLQARHKDLKLTCEQLQYQQVSQPAAQPPVSVMPPPPPPPPPPPQQQMYIPQRQQNRDVIPSKYMLNSDWNTFILHFIEVVEINDWQEEYACRRLKLSLAPDAREQMDSFGELPSHLSFHDLVVRLTAIFKIENQESKAALDFQSRKKESNESFKQFCFSLCKLYRLANPGDLDERANIAISKRFIFGCGSKTLSEYLWAQKTRVPMELVRLAEHRMAYSREYEAAMNAAGNPKVADADLYAFNKKDTKKPAKDKVLPEPEVKHIAKTVATTVCEELGSRLSTQISDIERRMTDRNPYRGYGRGQPNRNQPPPRQGPPGDKQPGVAQQQSTQPQGNLEGPSKDSCPRQPDK